MAGPPLLDWFTPELEQVQAIHRERVARLYAGEPPAEVIAIAGPMFGGSHGLWGTNEIDMLEQPEAWLEDVLGDMARQASSLADPVTYRPLVIHLDPLGTHFVDALFGAPVRFHEGQVWTEGYPADLADLEPPDLGASALLGGALELARLGVTASECKLLVATPVFSCAANIGINLFGQSLLEALLDRPDAAHRALRIVNDVLVASTRAFAQAIPDVIRRTSCAESRYAPPAYGLIDGCATQLVSAAQYHEFFASLDAELLRVAPNGGMIHLCGAHTQHIPVWRGMPELRSVQLNDRATEDLEAYVEGLRPDQILYVAPTEAMTVERIIELTHGRPLVLQAPLAEPVPLLA